MRRVKYVFVLTCLVVFSNCFGQGGWVSLSTPQYNGYRINFIDRYTGFITGLYGGTTFLMTINGGLTWNVKSLPGNNYLPINVAIEANNKIYVGAGGEFFGYPQGKLYISSDGGNNWVTTELHSCAFKDIEFLNASTGIAGSGLSYSFESDGGIFKTTDSGMNWVEVVHDFFQYEYVDFPNATTGFAMGNHWIDAGYNHSKIMKTTNGGSNWFTIRIDSSLGFTPKYNKMQFLNNSTGYLLYTNLFKTTNGGQSWFEPYTFPNDSAKSFHFINSATGWISGRLGRKIYKTTDGGYNWAAQIIPVTNVSGEIFFLDEIHGWARATGTIILTSDTTGLMGISSAGTEISERFILHQNYPNPFNPVTKIKFDIPKQGFVSLRVYDITGKEVAVLVNNELAPGVYEYSFSASGGVTSLSSGVYFYKLQTNGFIQTRRMVLVK